MTHLSSRGNPRDVDGKAKAKLHGSNKDSYSNSMMNEK